MKSSLPLQRQQQRSNAGGRSGSPRRFRAAERATMKTNDDDKFVQKWLDGMSIEDKIGQMSQIDIGLLLAREEEEKDGRQQPRHYLNMSKVHHYVGKLGVGSVLNMIPDEPWRAEQYRTAVEQIQAVAAEHNRPPVIWGLDSVHGANYIHGAILAPQPLNVAATFNVTAAHAAGLQASVDTRAAGIPWLFSPLAGIALHPLWSRVYETFGEDPVVVGEMAVHMIRGIQQQELEDDNDKVSMVPSRAAACAKHFIGYSMPRNGHDRSPSWIPTRHLYQYFVPPWKRVVEKGDVLTVMESYTETSGVPNVANGETLRTLLRRRLAFEGVLVTDYEEIRNLLTWHHIVDNDADAVVHALAEGSVDMSMIPWDGFSSAVQQGLAQGRLMQDRIDESARRVLTLKHRLGMFDETIRGNDTDATGVVGQGREEMLDVVRQSIVLVKNEDRVLPLVDTSTTTAPPPPKILVTGPTANSLIYQSGGWTGQWQGVPSDDKQDWFTYGDTILQAFRNEYKDNTDNTDDQVLYACGVDILGMDCPDTEDTTDADDGVLDQVKDWVGLGPSDSIARAVHAAQDVQVVVVCVGEEAYTEKPGDIRSGELPEGQHQLVGALHEHAPDAKIVLLYLGGRARLLGDMVEHAHAVLIGFLPGPDAGRAAVDLMMGRANPSGRLPVTYPKYGDGGGIPYFHSVSDQCTAGNANTTLPHYQYVPCEVQWPFGHGLSYSAFAYTKLEVQGGYGGEDLQISVRVTNKGPFPGADAILFFTFDDFRSTTPEYKRLRAFEKVWLEVDETQLVTKTVPFEDLAFIGPHDDSHYVHQPDLSYWVGVGADADCRQQSDQNGDSCEHVVPGGGNEEDKARTRANTDDAIPAACLAACDLWTESGCSDSAQMSPSACLTLCAATTHPSTSMSAGNDGWGWNYVNCLEPVVFGLQQHQQKYQGTLMTGDDECWKMTSLCRNIFETEQMDPFGMGGSSSVQPDNRHQRGGGTTRLDHVPAGNYVALLVGLASAAMIAYLINGGSISKLLGVLRRRSPGVVDHEGEGYEYGPATTREDHDNGH